MALQTALSLLMATLLVAGCGSDPESQPASPIEKPIVAALKKGGHTLVIRHSIADAEINRREKLSSCTLQRNLTVAGKEQARMIGEGIRALEIPITEVRASPLCRARDTARLAFGEATEDRDLISPGVIGTEADDARRAEKLRATAESPPPAGQNVVLVSHIGNIGAAFGEETIAEGETLVLGEGAEVAGRVKAEEWAELAD